MESISQAWRAFYQAILSISPLWWSIIAVVAVLSVGAYLAMRGR